MYKGGLYIKIIQHTTISLHKLNRKYYISITYYSDEEQFIGTVAGVEMLDRVVETAENVVEIVESVYKTLGGGMAMRWGNEIEREAHYYSRFTLRGFGCLTSCNARQATKNPSV
jgi:hypothetical protein